MSHSLYLCMRRVGGQNFGPGAEELDAVFSLRDSRCPNRAMLLAKSESAYKSILLIGFQYFSGYSNINCDVGMDIA